ncbi:MAG: NAD(P)-binding domain-containing protein [Lachnospiraceae bacterium]|nr:NAD(P)-binding domain-containing protein [Lachnospiraceae bacterium]
MGRDVLILSFSFEQEEEAFRVVEQGGFNPLLLAEKDRKGWTEKELAAYWNGLAQKPPGIIMGADIPLGEEFVRAAQGLRAVSLNCAGSDHLDLDAFHRAGIVVCNVPRQNFDAVADFVWGQILALMRRIPLGDRTIRRGQWCSGVERGIAVSGKTLGIIGFGAIGQAIAARAAGFGMRLIVSSTSRKPEPAARYGAVYVERETLFREADIIVPSCPLTPETRHIINEETLSIMKPGAVVVNSSRGGIIHTPALMEALRRGTIAGAALDVYEEEPLLDSELFELDNVVLTPHMAGLADREIHNVAMQAARHIVDLLSGRETNTEI